MLNVLNVLNKANKLNKLSNSLKKQKLLFLHLKTILLINFLISTAYADETTLVKGQKLSLNPSINTATVTIEINPPDGMQVDLACFGLDQHSKLDPTNEAIAFFNKTSIANDSVNWSDGSSDGVTKNQFEVQLSAVPREIQRLTFVASTSLHGDPQDPALNQIQSGRVIFQSPHGNFSFSFTGADFESLKAAMVFTIYRHKGQWKINAQIDGFNGGLRQIIEHFGGKVEEEKEQTPPSQPKQTHPPQPKVADPTEGAPKGRGKVLLEKVERTAPYLVDLTKRANIVVEKQGLGDVDMDVILVLDGSGSMKISRLYPNRIQKLIDRVVPLALRLGTQEKIPCYGFACRWTELPSIGLENVHGYISKTQLERQPVVSGKKFWVFGEEVQERRSDGNVFHGLGYTNNEPELFNHLVEKYKNSRKPVHIIVVHDGGIHKSREIEQIIRASSNYPIFWQFLGWGGKDYGILEHLDDMKGRDVDNCDFSAIEMKQIDKKGPEGDAFFLHLMTKETPGWLKKVLRRNWIDAAFCRSIAARLQ